MANALHWWLKMAHSGTSDRLIHSKHTVINLLPQKNIGIDIHYDIVYIP